VKERRKPDPLRQSRETGGGLAFEISSPRKGRGIERALVEGRRLGSRGGGALDGAPRKSGSGGGQRFARSGARPRQETSEVDPHSSPAEDNAAERGASLRGLADIGAHQDSGTPAAAGSAEACAEQSAEARVASSNASAPVCPAGFTPADGDESRKWRGHTGNRAIDSRCT